MELFEAAREALLRALEAAARDNRAQDAEKYAYALNLLGSSGLR